MSTERMAADDSLKDDTAPSQKESIGFYVSKSTLHNVLKETSEVRWN